MKRTLALLLSILVILPLLASCGRRKLNEPIELIVANDIHYVSPPFFPRTAALPRARSIRATASSSITFPT